MIRYLLLIAVGLALWTEGAQALDITFLEHAEVDRDTVRLGDIAKFSESSELADALAGQTICAAPDAGETLAIDSRSVILQFAKGNFNLANTMWRGSSGVSVSRNSITVSSSEILAVIDRYLTEQKDRLPEANIRFLPDSQPLPFAIPTGRLEWEVIPSSPDIIGSSRYALICRVNGKVRRNFSVLGHTEAIAPVVVALKTFTYGDIITADSIELAPRDLAELENYTAVAKLVVGSQVTRTIRSGTAIDTASLEQPPLIERGEPVKIVVNYRGLHLSATGIAKADGRKGEMIRVRNSSSNKLIYCRVEAPGIVEVRL